MPNKYVPKVIFEADVNAPDVRSGYDAKATKLESGRREAALALTNASIILPGGEYATFFCPRVSLDLSLAGSRAQGRYVRDFYAHNIEIPSLSVVGQCVDQEHYGNFVECVRQGQIQSVQNGKLTQLSLNGGGLPAKHHMKGTHDSMVVQGFVKTMPRRYERWAYAPLFTFEFVIADMTESALFHEKLTKVGDQKHWQSIVEAMVQPSQAAKEVKEVGNVQKNTEKVVTTIVKGIEGFEF